MQLDHPLDGIAEKLKRADENIKNLNSAINEFLVGEPRPYRVDRGFYDDPTKYEFRVYATRRLPLRLSVLAGEIVHHLRSCMDHLIVALAGVNGQRPLNNHQFPVCRKREKFKKACAGRNVKGVSRSALKRIIKAQPYRHASPLDSTINVIHQLDIRDKHSLLVVVAQTAQIRENINFGTRHSEGPKPVIISLGKPGPRIVTEEGVEAFAVLLESPVPDFYADAEFAFQVAFANIGGGHVVPVIPTLTKTAAFTAQAEDDFNGLLVGSFRDEF